MSLILSGKYNERIHVYKPVISRNEFNELFTTYGFDATYHASVIYKSGLRAVENDEVVFNYTRTFIVRNYADITEKDRISWNGEYYRIDNIDANTIKLALYITAEKINE